MPAIRRCVVLLGLLFLGLSGSASAQSSILNLDVKPIEVREDDQFQGVVATFSFNQPGQATARIEWGDGSVTEGVVPVCGDANGCPAGTRSTYEVRGSHVWADPNTYTVRVTVSAPNEPQPVSDTDSARVLARDTGQQPPPPQQQPPPPPPPALFGPPLVEGRPFTAIAGTPFTGVVAFVPPGPGLSAVIDWGDGTKSPGNVGSDGSITGTHTFPKAGLHQVTTTVIGPGGSSVGSSNGEVRLDKPPPECVSKVSFAKLTAAGTCILKIDENTWETKGNLRVRVNGLDIEPVAGKIRFLKKSAKLLATGTVIVRAGPITLYRGQLQLNAAADLPGGFNVAANAGVAGFPIQGSLAVRFVNDPTSSEWGATLDVHLGLPALFGGVTGDVALRLTNTEGLILDKLRLEAKSIYLGALHVQDLFIDYRRIGNEWRGGAKLSLPSGVALNAGPPPPEQGVTFRDGKLISLGATLTFPNPGVAIAGGVFLNSIGFQVGTSPTRFLGNAKFSTGSAGGKTLARIDASMFIAFARPDQPFTAPVGIPPKDRTFTSTAFHVQGTVTLADRFNLGGAYLLYIHPGYAEFAGEFNYNLLSGLVSAQARLGVAVNTVKGQFNGEVKARVCAAKVACVGGDLVISNVGAAACARTFLVDVGGGFYWSGGTYWMWRKCDVGRVRVAVTPNQARAAQDAGGPRFTLPAGLDKAVIGIKGRGDAPVVTLVSPSGQRFTVPAGDDWVNTRELVAFRADEADETYFVLPRPAAGTWTVEAAPGSPPVGGVQFAETLPEPSIRARVSGRGRARTLRYSVRPIDGQRVTLFEKGRDTMTRIGEARGTSGRLRFTAADASGGRRQIVAVVDSFGTPRDTLVAGSYTAPGPIRPARVRRLAVRAPRGRVCARWARSANAREYVALFRLSDGRRTLVVTRRRSACVRRVVGRVRGRVEVRGISARGARGTAARKAVPVRRARRR